MRLPIVRRQLFLQTEQGASWKPDDLLSVIDDVYGIDPHRVDDDDLAIVVVATGSRSACQARVGGLHHDDDVMLHAGDQRFPQLRQSPGLDDRDGRAGSESPAGAVRGLSVRVGDQIPLAHGRTQIGNKRI